jgi:hypothetical protein
MVRLRLLGVFMLGVFVFGGVVFGGVGVVAAQAEGTESAPYWSIEGTRLAAGKTFEVVGKSTSAAQTLTAGTDIVSCTTVKQKPGSVLVGSNGNEPGRSTGALQFGGCTVSGNGSGCAVENGTLETEPLTGELAYAENKKSLVAESDPVKGKILATLHFKAETDGTCTIASTKVTGLIVAKALTDEKTPVLLELPNHVTPAESGLLEAPSTPIRHIWLIIAGVGTAFETEELNAFGATSVYTGTGLVQLAVHGTAVTTKWCALF